MGLTGKAEGMLALWNSLPTVVDRTREHVLPYWEYITIVPTEE
jgi:hypothetical protein